MCIDIYIEWLPVWETQQLSNTTVKYNLKNALLWVLKENFNQKEFQNQWTVKIWSKIYRICTHWKGTNRKIFLVYWKKAFPQSWAQRIKYNQVVNWIECIKYRENIDSPRIYVDENLIEISIN